VASVQTSLFRMPQMGYKMKRRRYIDPVVIEEREEYMKKMSEYRKWHRAEYEKMQEAVDHSIFEPDPNKHSPV
jgi:recombinational DNA repair ATPase RecF